MQEALEVIHGATGADGHGVTVALLDTGICPRKDFEGRIRLFRDFVEGHQEPYDDNGHGTHVAGICGGDGALSQGRYRGVAPGCYFVALKILDQWGHGTAESAFAALKWLRCHALLYGIRVVNLSLGTDDPALRYPLLEIVQDLWEMGLVVVAAAGNDGRKGITAPGLCRRILTVGAMEDRVLFPFRENGLLYYKPDLFAPGENIISCKASQFVFDEKRLRQEREVGEYYVKMSGTSMATPMVSGACAQILGQEPYLTADEVKERLVQFASPRRLLNVQAALNGK